MRFAALSFALLLLGAGAAFAHGLRLSAEGDQSSVVIRSYYDDGTAVDAEALVYSPADPDATFQLGRTDRNGLFSFVPDAEGEWLVVVDDGMGHREVIEVMVDAAGLAGDRPATLPWRNLILAAAFVLAALLYRRRLARKAGA